MRGRLALLSSIWSWRSHPKLLKNFHENSRCGWDSKKYFQKIFDNVLKLWELQPHERILRTYSAGNVRENQARKEFQDSNNTRAQTRFNFCKISWRKDNHARGWKRWLYCRDYWISVHLISPWDNASLSGGLSAWSLTLCQPLFLWAPLVPCLRDFLRCSSSVQFTNNRKLTNQHHERRINQNWKGNCSTIRQ